MVGKIRKRIIIYLTLFMTVLFAVPVSAAKEPEFRMDADSLNFQKGVSSNIVVSMINAKDAQIISIEGLENFDVLSQSQSTSTSIVNNDMTQQVNMYYVVMPKTTGEFSLKANIEYNGQYYESNQLQVTITEESNNENTNTPDLFVKTIVSHDGTAYLGEKIVVTYELYSRYNIDGLGFTDYIAIDGAVVKEMPDEQMKNEYIYIDGNKYVMYEVKQLIIDPMKSGTCIIPSFNLQVNIITGNNSSGGFGGFFHSTTPKYLQTEEKELSITPLPTNGRPADFSGIIGQVKLNGDYTRTELNYGDSLALQIEASGNCNLDGIKSIVTEIPGFTVYETHKNTTESVEDNKYNIQKTFEAILIPEKTGTINVDPISISYFNPENGQYETASIQEETIEVLGTMPQSNTNNSNQESAIETIVINQISYADINDNYFMIQIKKEWIYIISITIIILIGIIALVLWFISKRKKQNPILKSLYKKLMSTKDINEVYNLFNDMIKHRYNLNLKASSQHYIKNNLTNVELATKVTDIMSYMESKNAYGEKGEINLKDKIKNIYTSKLL